MRLLGIASVASFVSGCQLKKLLEKEKQDFLADVLEEFDSACDDLQFNTTSIFKADHVYAFDSDCDEALTASAICMARLSPTGLVNGNDVNATYNSDILFEADYTVTIKNDDTQSVPPPEQDNAKILFVIEKMQRKVE
nr:hypothetical protein [Tanacetum cinerariifolium]